MTGREVSMDRERGSALLMVVIVLLVLSGIGMAMVVFTETDQDSIRWGTHSKDALYVAEMGLRVGESVLAEAASVSADTVLQHVSVARTVAAPREVPLFPEHPGEYDLQHLGTYLTDGGVELANRPIALPTPASGRTMPEAFVSLYVRNNAADIAVADADPVTDARQDNDFIVNLVSVGWVQVGGRVLAVKILEEQYGWFGVGQEPSVQKLKDAGGTSSAQFGG
jgi:hypothetical protein